MPAAVLFFAAFIVAPLFGVEYLANWGTIDSTFIADARFLAAHWPHPSWQPLWYCGTRFDYIYPPAVRYGSAALSMLLHTSAAHAYHIYTAALYCLGILGVYAFLGVGQHSRWWAAIGAAAAAVLSPSFLILPAFRNDAALHMPQRLNVLVKWGEGPHIAALCVLPFALAFAWRALSGGSRVSLVLAAFASALVVAHNFYGATALAALYALMVWSVWITRRERTVLWRAASIPLLAYGLCAFWLTPSYLRITLENLKLVAQPGNAWSRWTALAGALLFAAISWRLARGRKERAWPVFVAGSVAFFGAVVIGHYFAGFRVAGEPHRYVPELDLVLIIGAVELLRRLRPAPAGILVLAAFTAASPYLFHPWSVISSDPNYTARVEYRLAAWIAKNDPRARTFATGSLRLWYDAWYDGEQVGGGSEQGLENGALALVQWQVMKDPAEEVSRDIAWLQAVGADLIVVPEPNSGALFLEYTAPFKFAGLLPKVYDDGAGNVIYRVPRRFPAHARIVGKTAAAHLAPIPVSYYNDAQVKAYAAVIENGPDRPVEMTRSAPDAITLRADIHPGESIVVQESFDPAWRAWSGGRPVPISKDVAGFMRLDPPPGAQQVEMRFELPLENLLGRVISVLSLIGAAVFAAAPRSAPKSKTTARLRSRL